MCWIFFSLCHSWTSLHRIQRTVGCPAGQSCAVTCSGAQCPVAGKRIIRTVSVVPLHANLGSHVCTHACAFARPQVHSWFVSWPTWLSCPTRSLGITSGNRPLALSLRAEQHRPPPPFPSPPRSTVRRCTSTTAPRTVTATPLSAARKLADASRRSRDGARRPKRLAVAGLFVGSSPYAAAQAPSAGVRWRGLRGLAHGDCLASGG